MTPEERDISPGKHFCHVCRRVTNWIESRGVQRCDGGCGERFPCASRACGHQDCQTARGRKSAPVSAQDASET